MASNNKNNAQNNWTRIGQQVEESKRAAAKYLENQSDKLSPKGRRIAFLFFGIVMGAICLSLIMRPFHVSETTTHPFPQEIITPITPVPIQENDSVFSEGDYRTLVAFKLSMDSLKQANPVAYEDVMKNHRGFMDSVNFLISIYHQ